MMTLSLYTCPHLPHYVQVSKFYGSHTLFPTYIAAKACAGAESFTVHAQ